MYCLERTTGDRSIFRRMNLHADGLLYDALNYSAGVTLPFKLRLTLSEHIGLMIIWETSMRLARLFSNFMHSMTSVNEIGDCF